MFRRKLEALEYPSFASFTISDSKNIKNLIIWLEDTKIRFYAPTERKSLKETEFPQWLDVFEEYLAENGSTLEGVRDPKVLMKAVDWLLNVAVSMDYQDKKDAEPELKVLSAQEALASSTKAALERPSTLKCDTPAFDEAVARLAALLKVPTADLSTDVQLKAVVRRLEGWVQRGGALQGKEGSKESNATLTDQKVAMSVLDALPLGFETGDVAVDRASTLLRLLYIGEARELQTKVNEVITLMQECTADPRADGRLGVVGR